MKKLASVWGALLIVLSFSAMALAADMEGTKAPDFTLKSVDGKQVKLATLLEEGPVLVDFWATWCKPCKQAMPHLAKIYEGYKDQGFTLVGISVDNTRSVAKVRPYVRSQGFKFPVLLDTDSRVLKSYRGRNVPHLVLINKEGVIQNVWMGYHAGEEKEIEAVLKGLLGGQE